MHLCTLELLSNVDSWFALAHNGSWKLLRAKPKKVGVMHIWLPYFKGQIQDNHASKADCLGLHFLVRRRGAQWTGRSELQLLCVNPWADQQEWRSLFLSCWHFCLLLWCCWILKNTLLEVDSKACNTMVDMIFDRHFEKLALLCNHAVKFVRKGYIVQI